MKKLLLVLAVMGMVAIAGNAWAVPSISSMDGLVGAGEWDGAFLHMTDPHESDISDAYNISDVYVYEVLSGVDAGLYFRVDTFAKPKIVAEDNIAPATVKILADFNGDNVFEDTIYVNYYSILFPSPSTYDVVVNNSPTNGKFKVDNIWEIYVPQSSLTTIFPLQTSGSGYLLLDNGGDSADDRVPDRAVPEPMSISLLGLGLLGVVKAGFRKK